MMHTVFLYGTLRRGGSRDITRHWPSARFLGEATLHGKIFELRGAGFPALVLGGDALVVGELFFINEAVLRDLDQIEGYNAQMNIGLYLRKKVEPVSDGLSADAWTYEAGDQVRQYLKGQAHIESGDWIKHAEARFGLSSR